MLGLTRCPNCSIADYADQHAAVTHWRREMLLDLAQEARELRMLGASRAAVNKVLRRAGLVLAHAYAVCPFLRIPHFQPDCFVPEGLHEWYDHAAYYMFACIACA